MLMFRIRIHLSGPVGILSSRTHLRNRGSGWAEIRPGAGRNRPLPAPLAQGRLRVLWDGSAISIPDQAKLVGGQFGTPPAVQVSELHSRF